MFNENGQKWAMAEIDQLDVHFFHELLEPEEERKVYIDEIW